MEKRSLMHNLINKIKGDWERSIFIIAVLVFIVTGLVIAVISLDFFGDVENTPMGSKKIDNIYADNAFAFLDQENISPKGNAFEQQETKVFKPKLKPRPKKYIPREKTPVKPNPEVKPKVKKPKVPKAPPVNYYIRYVGYMASATGEMRAWLKAEQVQNDKTVKSELHVSEEGDKVNKYIVTSFDENQIILQTTTGGTLTINKGDRVHVATVQP
jgi:hypothetical protein